MVRARRVDRSAGGAQPCIAGAGDPGRSLERVPTRDLMPSRNSSKSRPPQAAGTVMASSDDDYGDLDETAFFDAATQVERENSPAFQRSPRATKRRKLAHRNERAGLIPPRKHQQSVRSTPDSGDEDDQGSALSSPSTISEAIEESATLNRRAESADKENGNPEDVPTWKRAKKDKQDRIYQPTKVVDMPDVFFTQPPQEYSPPWKPRGAIWQKAAVHAAPAKIGIHRPSLTPQRHSGNDIVATHAITCRPSPAAPPFPRQSHGGNQARSPCLPSTNRDGHEIDPTDELADLPSDAFASSSSSPQKADDVMSVSERRTKLVAPQTGLRQTTLFGRNASNGQVPASQVNKRYNFVVDRKAEPPTHHKLEHEAMKTWVYPNNLGSFREYQNNIVRHGLFNNLLVALPTGLGKTFIAATIMLNWYRWTTEAQIVFVAPTRPLVAQQVEACFNIVGIPRHDTTMLTGGVPGGLRAEEWTKKRVFFMTPQTLLNDLKSGIADPKRIVLLVVDEAHKATGSYAYVEVVSMLRRFNPSYRILALTATPGADVEAVQKVIDGLDIAEIEIRTEKSLDIVNYVHQRKIEKHVFTNSDEMEMCMDLYSTALQPLVSKIAGLNAFWSNDPKDLTPFGCTQARIRWSAEAGRQASFPVKSMVNTIFAILGSLSHGMELLKYHGIGPFYMKMKEFRDDQAQSKSKYKKEITDSEAFRKLMTRLQGWVTSPTFDGHPKTEFLQQVILDHFVNAAEGHNVDGAPPSQTRIMVFAHFRDSAEEIVRILKKHEPMIRPRVFVGQAGGKNSEGMNQKAQLKVIEDFKSGIFNTLVATSIGEEGLDIGEVDLIVCYDSKASPIRMLQRMGRTGRKREGKIILLQMKGKEENDAQKAKDSYEKMQELIAKGDSFAFHDDVSRRILPHDAKPVEDRRVVEIPLENSQSDFLPVPRKGGRVPKRPPKKFHMPDNVITGFVKAGRMDEQIAQKPRVKKTLKPAYPSEEVYSIPLLDSVLLDERANKDLDRRYQTVHNTDSLVVGPVDLHKYPAAQHRLARTKHFSGPGRATRRYVETVRRMYTFDDERLEGLKKNLHLSDCDEDANGSIVVLDKPEKQSRVKAAKAPIELDDTDTGLPRSPKVKAKTGSRLNSRPKAAPGTARPAKSPAPRGRPRKSTSNPTEPAHAPDAQETPKTPRFRMSEMVDEAASSSPPPTDPRFRLATQGIDIGSDDTIGEQEVDNTQAYRLDSDLRDFIADDNSEVQMSDSSLPDPLRDSFGAGTQALVKEARQKRKGKAEKLFTSDTSDNDGAVSSDSDDDAPLRPGAGVQAAKVAYVVDSTSGIESDGSVDKPAVLKRQRARRVVEDDDDE